MRRASSISSILSAARREVNTARGDIYKLVVYFQDLARELDPSEKAEPVLIIATPYGEKRFPASELQRVTAVTADGAELDLTDGIRQILQGNTKDNDRERGY